MSHHVAAITVGAMTAIILPSCNLAISQRTSICPKAGTTKKKVGRETERKKLFVHDPGAGVPGSQLKSAT
ncbi:uncharacterized protein PADG_08699 [Paracoccidioides brasiliensis Pb18]|uniref:Uncharacterized protein n=1 Tax=Paracoccidioides brasiliensis (strain Pb18) TaxID=502780 RepID=C1GN55_PARBD|nr:uncharacterized protein PADG_08699 [Paracoccidioides brasiliensis Pb18]EEH46257.1 hypothetical protein PADG_08699 [Paracoccidioides brasiliensis Pb18]